MAAAAGMAWVVQKYIENPLIIAQRKFDLRQWVLVTDWAPLAVWFFEDCYVRFAAEDYTAGANSSEAAISNRFVHLVNNSIVKDSSRFNHVAVTDSGFEINECMWDAATFGAYLRDRSAGGARDVLELDLKPRMRDIVCWSLQTAQESVEHRKGSWELYGYDFMVDDALRPWLIEVNSSPACDYSTRVTERYVREALHDLIKVTVDLPAWEATQKAGGPAAARESGGGGGSSGNGGEGGGVNGGSGSGGAGSGGSGGGDASTLATAVAASAANATAAVAASAATVAVTAKSAAAMSSAAAMATAPGDSAAFCSAQPPDTGKWKQIYKGSAVPRPVAALGCDMLLQGRKITKSRLHRA
ncbi:unnamed protein product [Phaeothamnion confervicola]